MVQNTQKKEYFATINPYRTALGLILYRLAWDLNPESWRARKRLKLFSNKYKGQKALILCNGPSLNGVDFEMVQKSEIFTFGLNKINLLFKRTAFRPSTIISVNPHVIEQNSDFFNTTTIPVFIDSDSRRFITNKKAIFLHSSVQSGHFAKDCSISVNQGHTVTYVAMQLAFYMGFTNVGLVGCDHSFSTKGPANKAVKAGKVDIDHFDPNYFSKGVTWELPDLTASELHYEIARDTYYQNRRKIINCTEGGNLEVFERQSFTSFLKM